MKRRGFLQALLGLLCVPKVYNLLPASFNPEMGKWKHVLASWDMSRNPTVHYVADDYLTDKVAATFIEGKGLLDNKSGVLSVWVREDKPGVFEHFNLDDYKKARNQFAGDDAGVA